MTFQFWWRWLMVVTGGVIVYSLGLMFLPTTMHQAFNTLFYGASDANGDLTDYISLIYGVLGAVIIGWMVMLMSILMTAFRRGEREAWQTIVLSMVIWFVVDSGFSIYIGVIEHAIFNVIFMILFAIPLGATYPHFNNQHPTFSSSQG